MQKLSKVLGPFMYIKNFIMRNFNSQHSLYEHLPFIKNVTTFCCTMQIRERKQGYQIS